MSLLNFVRLNSCIRDARNRSKRSGLSTVKRIFWMSRFPSDTLWRMRQLAVAAFGLMAFGCTKGSSLPEQPIDDPSARTTTAINAPSTPQEMAVLCDVPFYPGAQAPDMMSRLPRRDTDGNMTYELVLTTEDSPVQASGFYAKALNLPAAPGYKSPQIIGQTPKGNSVIITATKEGGRTVIRIRAIAHDH
jgi:hypothetical protein